MSKKKFFVIVIVALVIAGIFYVHYLERKFVNGLVTENNELSSLLMNYAPLNTTFDKPLENKIVPSIEDLDKWLQEDQTDTENYSDPDFICYHFAGMLAIHARTQGYDIGVVWIHGTFNSTNEIFYHAINAIVTAEGLVYLEPQMDEVWWFNDHQEMTEGKIYDFPICSNKSIRVEKITVVLKY